MSSESLKKYEFKQSLERLKDYKVHATELVSLYIPPDRKIYDVQSYLRNEASQSANIKSKSTRKNVSAAIESITSRLKMFKEAPENDMKNIYECFNFFFLRKATASGFMYLRRHVLPFC